MSDRKGRTCKSSPPALGFALAGLLGAPAVHAAVASVWYLTFDPVDAVVGTQAGPQEIIS